VKVLWVLEVMVDRSRLGYYAGPEAQLAPAASGAIRYANFSAAKQAARLAQRELGVPVVPVTLT
jgi:hypothetical protein